MSQPSFLDKVRLFISHIAWSIFLWANRMTQEQYLDRVIQSNCDHAWLASTLDGVLAVCSKCGVKNYKLPS